MSIWLDEYLSFRDMADLYISSEDLKMTRSLFSAVQYQPISNWTETALTKQASKHEASNESRTHKEWVVLSLLSTALLPRQMFAILQ